MFCTLLLAIHVYMGKIVYIVGVGGTYRHQAKNLDSSFKELLNTEQSTKTMITAVISFIHVNSHHSHL